MQGAYGCTGSRRCARRVASSPGPGGSAVASSDGPAGPNASPYPNRRENEAMFRRVIVGSVIAAGLVAAAPAGAAGPPAAQMSGGDVPPPLPSLVQTRLTRVENALERLTEDVDEVDGVHGLKTSKVVRRQLAAAWRGARYYILHPPAPPADDARVHSALGGVRVRDLSPKVRAKITQDDGGPVIADPVTTAMAVFDEFHNISSTVIELTDGARVPVLDAMSKTLFLTLDRRDKAIADVHTLAPPPPPPEAEDAGVHAKAAQEEGAVTFDTTMPGLTMWLDDEIQHIDGLTSDATDLRPGGSRILTKARAQIARTEATINSIWPPATED